MPTEVNSMIVLDTSAGKGLWWLFVDSKWVGSETTEETEHFRVWNEDFRDGYDLLEGLKLGLSVVFERESDSLEDWVERKIESGRRDVRDWDC